MRGRRSVCRDGGYIYLQCFFLLVCAASSPIMCQDWSTPYFLKPPDPIAKGVNFSTDISTGTDGYVFVDENIHDVIVVAVVNYDGDTPPSCDGKFCSELKVEKTDGKWLIHLTQPQDYEKMSDKKRTVDFKIGSDFGTLWLAINNINDNPPVIEYLGEKCTVDENFQGKTECKIKVTDADGFGVMNTTVNPTSGNSGFSLELLEDEDKSSIIYHLVVDKPLNYEFVSLRSINITAEDYYLEGLETGNLILVVWVNDLPDELPVWNQFFSTQTIDENEAWAFNFTAKDGDIVINADISYELTLSSEGDKEFFSIDEHTGLYKVEPIDRDKLKISVYKMIVTAYETENKTSSIAMNITILVNDLNNNVPTISPNTAAVSIREQTSVTLNQTFKVADPDTALNGQFKIELVPNDWSSAFLLIPDSGYQEAYFSISVINSSAVDYEDPDWQKITLKVIAKEEGDPEHTSTADITITVIDWNDEYPVFDSEIYIFSIKEDADVGASIGTVTANDRDFDDEVTYSLSQKGLTIDKTSGLISVSAKNVFDYEREKYMVIQVIAADNKNHPSTAQVNITVIDVNDEAPTLRLSSDRLEVVEDAEAGVILNTSISATDEDDTSKLKFTIDWERTYASKQGRWISNSSLYKEALNIVPKESNSEGWQAQLEVRKKDVLDWVQYDTLYLVIVVNDTETDEKYRDKVGTKDGTLPLNIKDVNNNPPEFTEQSINANRSVVENTLADRIIGNVIATDKDSVENGNITYSIEPLPDFPPGMVVIDGNSGEIKTGNEIIDRERFAELKYIVSATDQKFCTNFTITIYVIDQNDMYPTVIETEEGNIIEIYENTKSGYYVTKINATDGDSFWKYRTLKYMFYDPQISTDYFTIDSDTGIVKVNLTHQAVLDRETRDTYTLTFIVRDNFMEVGSLESNRTTITVKLLDENDESPEFKDLFPCAISTTENITEQVPFFTGQLAVDKDDPESQNSKFEYRLESIQSLNGRHDEEIKYLFSIRNMDSGNGTLEILSNSSLADLWGHYNVSLSAMDRGENAKRMYHSYIVCVNDTNTYAPEITYPENNQRIHLSSKQTINSPNPLIDAYLKPLKDFTAEDRDDNATGNGQVTFSIKGNDDAQDYFRIESGITTGRLILKKPPPTENRRPFELTLIATDKGETPLSSEKRVIKIIFVNEDDSPPMFKNNTQTLFFPENTITVTNIIHLAWDIDNDGLEPDDEFWETTSYTLYNIQGDYRDLFSLNNKTGEISLNKPLDYEDKSNYSLTILAYTNSIPENPIAESLLHLTIQVQDMNDMPPEFATDKFQGVFLTTDKFNKDIVLLKATDKDTEDEIKYYLIKDSINVSDDSLNSVKDKIFTLDGDKIKLAMAPPGNLKGHFDIEVHARDSMNPQNDYHMDKALVQIFAIRPSNVVQFNFLNSQEEVNNNTFAISDIFKRVLRYVCGVDNVEKFINEDGKPSDNKTVVEVHFVDEATNEAVEKDIIFQKVNDVVINTQLKRELLKMNLDLIDYSASSSTTENSIYLQTILISVSAVLGVMVLVLFVAFFVRTRTLNKRLEKLSTTKFGSQDSGLNRVGLAVPNTNRHAVEGSNPVWNEEVDPNYDNMSQGSGDSDLIGIEDSPEFSPNNFSGDGLSNAGFISDRRTSVNPLSNINGDSEVPRSSINPLSSSFESISNNDLIANNSNFSFRKPDSVPATEL